VKACLIVVDMLHDFMDERGALFCGPGSREIIPNVVERAREFRSKGWPVIFTCDAHAEDDLEFEMFPRHAVKGSPGAEIIPEMGANACDFHVNKTRFDAFYNTELASILEKEGVTEAEVAGVCTSICVLFTVQTLRNRDCPVTVRRNCVADFDDDAHAFALKHMEKVLGVTIV